MSNIFDYVLFWHGDLSSILMVGSIPVQANVKQRVSIEAIAPNTSRKVTVQSPTLSAIQQGVSIPDAVCEETSVSVSLS